MRERGGERGRGEGKGDVLSAPVSTHCIGSIIELWLSQRFGWLGKGLWVGWSYSFPMFCIAFACALRSQTLHNNVRIPLLLLVTSQANKIKTILSGKRLLAVVKLISLSLAST